MIQLVLTFSSLGFRFCPSVFLYLGSVVPAIWLLELDKLDKRQRAREGLSTNATSAEGLRELDQLLGVRTFTSHQKRLDDIIM